MASTAGNGNGIALKVKWVTQFQLVNDVRRIWSKVPASTMVPLGDSVMHIMFSYSCFSRTS